MPYLLVEGGHTLSGEVEVQGAKNSVLPILAACLLCGYCIPWSFYLPAVSAAAVLLAAGVAALRKWRRARIPVAVLLGLTVGFCWMLAHDALQLFAVRAYDGHRAELSVVVIDTPEETDYGQRMLGVTKLNGKYQKVMLYLYDEEKATLGDTVSGSFLLRSTLTGGSRDSSYNRGEGIFLMVTSGKSLAVTTPEHLPWYCYPALASRTVTQKIQSLFPQGTTGFAKALLLGQTDELDYKTNSDLKTSGIAHVVAVSGMHVTILFGLLYFVTARRRLLVVLLGFPALFFFAAMVGFSPSVTRACLMNGLMMVGLLFEREYDSFTSLAFAVLVMLLGNPYVVVSVSFQLSVMCMVGIFLLAGPIRDWLMEKRRLGKYRRARRLLYSFSVAVGISLGATITTAPLCALYFGMVSIVSLITNILTLWLITYVFYGIMAACLLAGIFLPLGRAAARLCGLGIRCVLALSGGLAAFPVAAVYVASPYITLWLVFCYGLLGAYLLIKRKRPMLFGCLAAMSLCLCLLLSWWEPRQDQLRVTVLDVGQGQCVLLQSEGRSFLVDCGGSSDTMAADTAAAQLLSQGITCLAGVILTHYDEDYIGGVKLLLSRVSAKALYLPEGKQTDPVAQGLLAATGSYKVTELTKLTFGQAALTLIPSPMGKEDNESGLCILFQRGNCDILITGDRSQEGERELLASLELPELEVLVVGHHGSNTSTGWELLEKTTPEIAVISVGENSYGHPTQQVLDRLAECGCTVYRTDLDGTIVIRR